MLEINNLSAGYSKENNILENVNFSVGDNEIIVIVGQNGSGKSTLAKAIFGMVPQRRGNIFFNGDDISSLKAQEIFNRGIGFFMQGGRIFENLTVEENLKYAASGMKRTDFDIRIDEIRGSFEEIFGKFKDAAGTLSGGLRHKLGLAMVLMCRPKMLILDEPSAGLSPANIKSLYQTLDKIKQNEVKSMMIIEQNVSAGIEFSNRALLLQDKIIFREEFCNNLDSLEKIDEFYFGKLYRKET